MSDNLLRHAPFQCTIYMLYTATQIRDHISTRRDWLERSILAIYKSTGFRDTDKDYLDYVAQWIEAGKPLSGKHIRRARALMMKYAGQLAEMAKAPANHDD